MIFLFLDLFSPPFPKLPFGDAVILSSPVVRLLLRIRFLEFAESFPWVLLLCTCQHFVTVNSFSISFLLYPLKIMSLLLHQWASQRNRVQWVISILNQYLRASALAVSCFFLSNLNFLVYSPTFFFYDQRFFSLSGGQIPANILNVKIVLLLSFKFRCGIWTPLIQNKNSQWLPSFPGSSGSWTWLYTESPWGLVQIQVARLHPQSFWFRSREVRPKNLHL